jgi:hypothetical protein
VQLSDAQLREMYDRAIKCDDDIRKARGLPPRPTRCRSCVTILMLLAHIHFSEAADVWE